MNKFLMGTKRFLTRNSSTILTCVGAVGVVITAVTAAKATPKAMAVLSELEQDSELTATEKIKAVAPAYIPTALIGASTIACIFGANALNKRQQAALTSAYALLDTSYREYRGKVREIFAEEGERRVVEAIAESQYSEQNILEANDGRLLFFDFYSLQFFRSTMEEVERVEKYMNDTLKSQGYVPLGEFYNKLGIPNWDVDWSIGWSKYAGDLYGYDHIEFDHCVSTMDNDETCYAIRFPFEPTEDYMM